MRSAKIGTTSLSSGKKIRQMNRSMQTSWNELPLEH